MRTRAVTAVALALVASPAASQPTGSPGHAQVPHVQVRWSLTVEDGAGQVRTLRAESADHDIPGLVGWSAFRQVPGLSGWRCTVGPVERDDDAGLHRETRTVGCESDDGHRAWTRAACAWRPGGPVAPDDALVGVGRAPRPAPAEGEGEPAYTLVLSCE